MVNNPRRIRPFFLEEPCDARQQRERQAAEQEQRRQQAAAQLAAQLAAKRAREERMRAPEQVHYFFCVFWEWGGNFWCVSCLFLVSAKIMKLK